MNLIEEKIILKYLVTDDHFFSKVFPFLTEKLFSEKYTKKLFSCIKEYNEKYNRKPTVPVMELFVEQVKGLSAADYAEMSKTVEYFSEVEEVNFDWLCDKTVEFIQSRTFIDALADAAEKYEEGKLDTELSEKLDTALSISLNTEIGMDFDDFEGRWESYTLQEDRIPFAVQRFNEVTKGGVTRKTLNCLMSSNTGGFKTGTMCSLAADYMRAGYNVLYLTFEMAENKIFERIDANMLDVVIDDIVNLGKENFITRISELRKKTRGKLIVKQFPTSMCHVGHIRYIIKDLKLKKKFIPDVIFFDYLGIMASMRYRENAAEHTILKAICEEVRGLCVEYNVIGWTAMQSNRGGASAGSDMSITDISASYGTVYGFDMLWGIITSEELDKKAQILIKQLKNRYSDISYLPSFKVGVNKGKMKVFDLVDMNNQDIAFTANDKDLREAEDATAYVFGRSYSRNKTLNTSSFKFGN